MNFALSPYFTQAAQALGRSLSLGILLLAVLPSWADKPDWAGQGKHHERKDDKKERRDGREGRDGRDDDGDSRDQARRGGYVTSGPRVQINIGSYFAEPQRQTVYQVYGPAFQAGRCPPGLARKHNGCQPPGQARAYALGQPLPPAVIYHDVPASVSVQIGLPPAGYRYVRVAADILLIAVGTGMVIDAIHDIGR